MAKKPPSRNPAPFRQWGRAQKWDCWNGILRRWKNKASKRRFFSRNLTDSPFPERLIITCVDGSYRECGSSELSMFVFAKWSHINPLCMNCNRRFSHYIVDGVSIARNFLDMLVDNLKCWRRLTFHKTRNFFQWFFQNLISFEDFAEIASHIFSLTYIFIHQKAQNEF